MAQITVCSNATIQHMKINQIIQENHDPIDPNYMPSEYILNQIRVPADEYTIMRKPYFFDNYGRDAKQIEKQDLKIYFKIFKFNTTPDWDLSAYCYDTVYDKLLLIYPGMEDSYLAVETISSTHNNKTRMCMSFPNREWYDRQIEKAKEDKII